MAQTTSDVLVERLVDWGVDTVFGIPGDGINGIMEALRTRKDRIRFVQTRHEEAAAFMACGHARVTGKLGVCLATSGPGGIHLLNGLYDAKLDGQPVLAITGLPYHDLIGTHTQQDVELDKLFMDVAVYNQRVMGATHVANVTDLACRTALACRGVAHVTIPVDIQDHQLDEAFRSKRNRPHASDAFARGIRVPADTDLRRAAEVLTAVKYRLPIKVVVIKNNTLGQIKWEQMVFLGNPEYGCELQPMDYAGFAEVSGMRGFRIEDPKTCGRTLDEALAVPGPALVEAVVDPFEPPMPGKISLDQAAMFARSLVRGEPNRAQIALTAVSNKVRELV